MAAKDQTRRKISASIAAIQRHHGAGDPRIATLHAQLGDAQLAEILTVAQRLAAGQEPLTASEVRSVARTARQIDARRKSAASTTDEAAAA